MKGMSKMSTLQRRNENDVVVLLFVEREIRPRIAVGMHKR
jgi:hypothetical protein